MFANLPQVFWKIRQISLCKVASPRWLSILLSLSAAHIVINDLLAAAAYGLSVELETAELHPLPARGNGLMSNVRKMRTDSSWVDFTQLFKCLCQLMNSSIFINPLPDIIGTVPSWTSLNISDFILFLGKIMASGKNKTTSTCSKWLWQSGPFPMKPLWKLYTFLLMKSLWGFCLGHRRLQFYPN